MATSDSSGVNAGHASDMLTTLISGGADVRLLTSVPSYTDTSADLGNYEVTATDYSAVSVSESSWTVNTGTSFTDAATLTNDNSISFGTAQNDWGTIEAIAVDGGTDFFMSPDPSATITAGEDVSIDAGAITEDLGN